VAAVSTTHLSPSAYSLIHWAWPFLSYQDRKHLCHIQLPSHSGPSPTVCQSANVFRSYAHLCTAACSQSMGYLRQLCHPATTLPGAIPGNHVHDHSITLLHYDFIYTDFIRSMVSVYTYQGCNNDALWDIINSVAHIPHAMGWLPNDFERTFCAMTLGIPLAGHFWCSFASVMKCNQYDNHAMIKTPAV